MGYDVENGGFHPVAGVSIGSRIGWRIFWGRELDELHLSVDAMLSDAQAKESAAKAKVSHAAFESSLPSGDIRTFYSGLTSARQGVVRRCAAALDGLIP